MPAYLTLRYCPSAAVPTFIGISPGEAESQSSGAWGIVQRCPAQGRVTMPEAGGGYARANLKGMTIVQRDYFTGRGVLAEGTGLLT